MDENACAAMWTNQVGYTTFIAQLPGIYDNINRPCPWTTPSDSGRFTAKNTRKLGNNYYTPPTQQCNWSECYHHGTKLLFGSICRFLLYPFWILFTAPIYKQVQWNLHNHRNPSHPNPPYYGGVVPATPLNLWDSPAILKLPRQAKKSPRRPGRVIIKILAI